MRELLFSKLMLFQWPSAHRAPAQVELSSIPSAFHHLANTKRSTNGKPQKWVFKPPSCKTCSRDTRVTILDLKLHWKHLKWQHKGEMESEEAASRLWLFVMLEWKFEISKWRVLCEKQSSHLCGAIDFDQSEQVWAIINNYCGPVFCDSGFKLRKPQQELSRMLCTAELCFLNRTHSTRHI